MMVSQVGEVRNGDFIYYTLNGTDTSYQLQDFLKFGADILFKYRGFL